LCFGVCFALGWRGETNDRLRVKLEPSESIKTTKKKPRFGFAEGRTVAVAIAIGTN
jgi:hypothetical protein